MEKHNHLNELELQDAASADVFDERIIHHLRSCGHCRAQVANYKMLATGLKDTSVPPLTFDLARVVSNRVTQREPSTPLYEKILYSIAGLLVVLGGWFAGRNLISVSPGSLLLIVPVVLFAGLSLLESKALQKKIQKLAEGVE